MKYILIGSRTMVFTVKQCAELYQTIYGGVIVKSFPTADNISRLEETLKV